MMSGSNRSSGIETGVVLLGRTVNFTAAFCEIVALILLGYFMPFAIGECLRYLSGENAYFGDNFFPTFISLWSIIALLFARAPWNGVLLALLLAPLAVSAIYLVTLEPLKRVMIGGAVFEPGDIEKALVRIFLVGVVMIGYVIKWSGDDHSIGYHRMRAWWHTEPPRRPLLLLAKYTGPRRVVASVLWLTSAALTAVLILAVLAVLFQGNHIFRIFILDPMVNLPQEKAIAYSATYFHIPLIMLTSWNLTRDLPGLIIFAFLIFVMFFLSRTLASVSRRLMALHAKSLLTLDPRPPVLFLRSFAFDSALLNHPTLLRIVFGKRWRLEECLAVRLDRYGPFVGIGKPGERLPLLGAARAYHADATWQTAIGDWIRQAKLIVLVPGETEWVRWELAQVAAADRIASLIIVMPPVSASEKVRIWGLVAEHLRDTNWSKAAASIRPETLIAVTFAPDGAIATVHGRRRQVIDYILALEVALSRTVSRRQVLTDRRLAPVATPANVS